MEHFALINQMERGFSSTSSSTSVKAAPFLKIPSAISDKTVGMCARFVENDAHKTLQAYYPQLNKIICVLRNAGYASDLELGT